MRLLRLLSILSMIGPIVIACGDDTPDVPVKTSVSVELTATSTTPNPCPDRTGSFVAFIDTNMPFSGTAEILTSSCHCKYTTTDNGWSCSDQRHCESSYDIGSDNPDTCTETRDPLMLGSNLTATTDRTCTVEVHPHPTDAHAFAGTLRCREAGVAFVNITVQSDKGTKSTRLTVYVFPAGNTPCAVQRQDAGDANDASEASDASDSG